MELTYTQGVGILQWSFIREGIWLVYNLSISR